MTEHENDPGGVPEVEGRRALLTERDRELIAGVEGDERRYEIVARVRRRVQDNLGDDVAFLKDHHPELLAEIRELVCDDEGESAGE